MLPACLQHALMHLHFPLACLHGSFAAPLTRLLLPLVAPTPWIAVGAVVGHPDARQALSAL